MSLERWVEGVRAARRGTETPKAGIAEANLWGEGYLAGLADMQNGQERDNPYRTKDRA